MAGECVLSDNLQTTQVKATYKVFNLTPCRQKKCLFWTILIIVQKIRIIPFLLQNEIVNVVSGTLDGLLSLKQVFTNVSYHMLVARLTLMALFLN